MKLKCLLLVFTLLLVCKAGISQTGHAAINKAWASLSKAYHLRNKSIIAIMDTLLKHKAIDNETYDDLSQQIKEYSSTLAIPGSFNRKYIAAIARRDEKIAQAFGKVILVSGAKGPDHYYLDQLEALENRIVLYRRIFNEACAGKGRKDLIFPLEATAN